MHLLVDGVGLDVFSEVAYAVLAQVESAHSLGIPSVWRGRGHFVGSGTRRGAAVFTA